MAAACALAEAPAEAKTTRECAQEYSAKAASGEAAGGSEAQYVKLCVAADAAEPPEGSNDIGQDNTKGQSASDLALSANSFSR